MTDICEGDCNHGFCQVERRRVKMPDPKVEAARLVTVLWKRRDAYDAITTVTEEFRSLMSRTLRAAADRCYEKFGNRAVRQELLDMASEIENG